MVELNGSNFYEVINNSDKPVFVDFYATWCGPCKKLVPNFETFANSNEDVLSAKADVDTMRDILDKLNILSVPTLVLFSGGKEVKRRSGYMTVNEMNDFVQADA